MSSSSDLLLGYLVPIAAIVIIFYFAFFRKNFKRSSKKNEKNPLGETEGYVEHSYHDNDEG